MCGRAIACDYDGTGASNGSPAPEVTTALHATRGAAIPRATPWQTFVPKSRPPARDLHTRRPASIESPPEKGFSHRRPSNGAVAGARTLAGSDSGLASVAIAWLHHHVIAGDSSRRAREVGDPDLASGLAKLEAINTRSASFDCDELRAHARARYVL